MHLRKLHANEYTVVASWAIAEKWQGAIRGQVLSDQSFQQLLQLPGHTSFGFARQDETVLGFGQIWKNEVGRTSLVRLLIAPHARGQGFGKVMCRLLCEEVFSTAKSDTLWLRVARENLAAVAVYLRLGFRVADAESNTIAYAMNLSLKAFEAAQSGGHGNSDA